MSCRPFNTVREAIFVGNFSTFKETSNVQMQTVTRLRLPADDEDFSGWTDAALTQAFSDCLLDNARSLRRLAMIWVERERRGADLSEFRTGIGRWVHLIAAGTLLPELVTAFNGRREPLEIVARLPIGLQQRLADGEKFEVAEGCRTIAVTVGRMRADQIAAAFGSGEYVPSAPPYRRQPPVKGPPEKTYKVSVDRDSQTVRIGNSRGSIPEMMAALAGASAPLGSLDDATGHQCEVATAKLTKGEKDRLTARAKSQNLPEHEVVRRAILAFLV